MKISGREAGRFLDRPDPAVLGFLLFGPEAGETAARKTKLVAALLGPGGDDMALTRLDGASIHRNQAELADALRSQGFFGGRSVVVLEGAGDAAAGAVEAALDGVTPDQAVLVVTAGNLKARSKLRALFEKGRTLAAVGIYANPPERGDIEAMFAARKAPLPDDEAMQDLLSLGRALDAGEFRGLVEKLLLYKANESSPVTPEDVAACAPLAIEDEVDALSAAVAGGEVKAVPGIIGRLSGQGEAPSSLSIGVTRHFRQLLALASAPDGPEAAAARARPLIFGPRRAAMLGQLRKLTRQDLEAALTTLTDTELALRSSAPAPAYALLERALMRIAMTARRRG